MKSSVDKCKVHIHWEKQAYFMQMMMGSELTVTTEEQDLRVMIKSSMKISAQCLAAARKKRCYQGRNREQRENTIIQTYKDMVHLDVDNCVTGKDAEKGNRRQKQQTGSVSRLGLSHEKRQPAQIHQKSSKAQLLERR